LCIKRYSGALETRNLGLEQFVEVRGFAILLGLPAALLCWAVNEPALGPMMASIVFYFLLGFVGEASLRIGFYLAYLVTLVTFTWLAFESRPPYIEMVIALVLHSIIMWNALHVYSVNTQRP